MNTIKKISLAIFVCLSLLSCKKSYECRCKTTDTATTGESFYEFDSKKESENKCNANYVSKNTGTNPESWDCNIIEKEETFWLW